MCARDPQIIQGCRSNLEVELLESPQRTTITAGHKEEEFLRLFHREFFEYFPKPDDVLFCFLTADIPSKLLKFRKVDCFYTLDEMHDLFAVKQLYQVDIYLDGLVRDDFVESLVEGLELLLDSLIQVPVCIQFDELVFIFVSDSNVTAILFEVDSLLLAEEVESNTESQVHGSTVVALGDILESCIELRVELSDIFDRHCFV